eukprot:Hpha_TRINITY_DN15651_c5_g2::TRINITY_DN15651_c5_g2_i1::g.100519::m.100519
MGPGPGADLVDSQWSRGWLCGRAGRGRALGALLPCSPLARRLGGRRQSFRFLRPPCAVLRSPRSGEGGAEPPDGDRDFRGAFGGRSAGGDPRFSLDAPPYSSLILHRGTEDRRVQRSLHHDRRFRAALRRRAALQEAGPRAGQQSHQFHGRSRHFHGADRGDCGRRVLGVRSADRVGRVRVSSLDERASRGVFPCRRRAPSRPVQRPRPARLHSDGSVRPCSPPCDPLHPLPPPHRNRPQMSAHRRPGPDRRLVRHFRRRVDHNTEARRWRRPHPRGPRSRRARRNRGHVSGHLRPHRQGPLIFESPPP